MKLLSLLFVSSTLAVSAFGVSPNPSVTKATHLKTDSLVKPAFRKDSAVNSPLFRDPILVRGGAVPGWQAYNKALDESPLTAKAFTSLVGWALGDVLAQVRHCAQEYASDVFVGMSAVFVDGMETESHFLH
jgi:hypothetical protein